jgi:hypothetical protein
MATPGPLPVDAGLLARLRAAGARIEWRDLPRARGRRPARLARLADEEARVEAVEGADGGSLRVESGPVGALVLLLEADRRGMRPRLEAWPAGRDRAFPSGAVIAHWSPGPPAPAPTAGADPPRLPDLIELARYALP